MVYKENSNYRYVDRTYIQTGDHFNRPRIYALTYNNELVKIHKIARLLGLTNYGRDNAYIVSGAVKNIKDLYKDLFGQDLLQRKELKIRELSIFMFSDHLKEENKNEL